MGENLRKTYPRTRRVPIIKITIEHHKSAQQLLEEIEKIENDIQALTSMSLGDYIKGLAVIDLRGKKEALKDLLVELICEM